MQNNETIHQHLNRYVKITMKDGKSYKGYIVKIEKDHAILASPHEGDESTAYPNSESRESRFFPFFWLALPLAYIAGVASRRPYRYPAPYYPSAAYPYPPYYPYGYPYYGYGYY